MRRVLVQAGHNPPREPGFESGTGTPGEIEYVKDMADRVLGLLKDDGRFEGIYAPGDIPNGIKVDAAIFLHCDGSLSPGATGYSFGFPAVPINLKLANEIDRQFRQIKDHPPHHANNYTVDMREYYGFSRVDTPGPEVLIEHGFLTNPAEAAWMRTHKNDIAAAEYVALCKFFGLIPRIGLWEMVVNKHVYAQGSLQDMRAFQRDHPDLLRKAGRFVVRRKT